MRSVLIAALVFATLLIFYKLTSITIPIITKEPPNISDITGIISAWTSIIALLGAIIAYQRWLQNKIRDDAYDFIKKYVAYMCELEYEIIDIFTRLNGLCPQEGLIPLHAEEALEALEEISERMGALDKAIRLLHTTKLELEHWDITLSEQGEQLHHSTMIGAHNFAVTFHSSLNSTGNYYANLEKIESNKLSDEIAQKLFTGMLEEDKKFKENTLLIREVFNTRRRVKFKKLFDMQS